MSDPLNLISCTGNSSREYRKENFETPKITKLSNGLQIISLDRGGYVANIGAFVKAGSRWERKQTSGYSKLIEMLVFQNLNDNVRLQTIRKIEELGASIHSEAKRECIEIHAEVYREKVAHLLPLIISDLMNISYSKSAAQHCLHTLKTDFLPNVGTAEVLMTEALHSTAWENNTLGMPLIPSFQDVVNLKELEKFKQDFFRPSRIVIAGVNVNHDLLCSISTDLMNKQTEHNFRPVTYDSTAFYTGGFSKVISSVESLCHLAIGFNSSKKSNVKENITLALLQMIMKGGETFSTGGPGKGMYTRLYQEVLTKPWVESCICFNFDYSDAGLFGLYIVAPASYIQSMIGILKEQLTRLSETTEEELARAQNALKSILWMEYENSASLLRNLASQIMFNEKITNISDLCNQVDSIQSKDIEKVAFKLLSTKPTVVIYSSQESYPDIANEFKLTN